MKASAHRTSFEQIEELLVVHLAGVTSQLWLLVAGSNCTPLPLGDNLATQVVTEW
jgi:hypothetical protein